MSAIKCIECSRPNAADARTCIWCGVPLVNRESKPDFEPVRAEVEYIEGFERIDGPATVSLTIGPQGIEIKELFPGTRSVVIASDQLLTVSFAGPLRRVGLLRSQKTVGWLRRNTAEKRTRKNRSALTIKYSEDGETRALVVERSDENGPEVLQRLARTIRLLIRLARG